MNQSFATAIAGSGVIVCCQVGSQGGAVARPSGRASFKHIRALPDGRATAPRISNTVLPQYPVAMSGLDNDLGSFISMASQRECYLVAQRHEVSTVRSSGWVSTLPTDNYRLPMALKPDADHVIAVYLALQDREQIQTDRT